MVEACREAAARADARGERLTRGERDALAMGYKEVVGQRRRALEALREAAMREGRGVEGAARAAEARAYAERVRRELAALCDEVDRTMERRLLVEEKIVDDGTSEMEALEARLFYLKMRGDYRRYIAEAWKHSRENDELFEARERAASAYEEAHKVAQQLPKTHPLRLGLALNRAVFHRDIYNDVDAAISIAKTAHDEAMDALEYVRDQSALRETAIVMRMLRENVGIWIGTDDDDLEDDSEDDDGTFTESSDESEVN